MWSPFTFRSDCPKADTLDHSVYTDCQGGQADEDPARQYELLGKRPAVSDVLDQELRSRAVGVDERELVARHMHEPSEDVTGQTGSCAAHDHEDEQVPDIVRQDGRQVLHECHAFS